MVTCITLSSVMQVSPEEMKSIMEALMKCNADLAGGGYTGQGHFYRCPTKHEHQQTTAHSAQ